MSYLSVIDKQTIRRLFGIADGYAFTFITNHNKTKTKELILDSCGINIFDDENYKDEYGRGLSQQKCIEKIWDTCSPRKIANMLKAFCDYYRFHYQDPIWNEADLNDYNYVETLIERLDSINTVSLPDESTEADLSLLIADIESNIQNEKPELAIDRLHTYSTMFLRNICQKHGISTQNDKGIELPLHSLVGNLKGWYEKNNYFESEFTIVAIRNSISIFDQFNIIRNNQSAAHPNELLNKTEAMYAVKIISETLTFIDEIERVKDKESADNIPAQDEINDDFPPF